MSSSVSLEIGTLDVGMDDFGWMRAGEELGLVDWLTEAFNNLTSILILHSNVFYMIWIDKDRKVFFLEIHMYRGATG